MGKHILMGNRAKGPDQVTYIQEKENNRRALRAFVMSFLRPDGVFMLRLIAANTTSINMTDLICNLGVCTLKSRGSRKHTQNFPTYNHPQMSIHQRKHEMDKLYINFSASLTEYFKIKFKFWSEK